MNRHVKVLALAAAGAMLWAGAIANVSAQQQQPPVKLEIRNMMLSAQQRAELQAAADRGVDELRRYVWRTRGIYNYFWPDLVGGPDLYF